MNKKGSPLTGKCACGSTDLHSRVMHRGKLRVACNRCSARVRQGGGYEDPAIEKRKRVEKAVKMRRAGKPTLEIARAVEASVVTVKRWLASA